MSLEAVVSDDNNESSSDNASEAVCKQLKNRLKNQSTEGSGPLELCFFAKTEVGHFVSV